MATSEQLKNVAEPGKPLTEQQENKLDSPVASWDDQRAQTIASNNFNAMENYRSQNHDWRFSNADQLILAWVPQRTWDGTRIPRSSIGIPLSMTQIQALLASVTSAMLPLRDNITVFPRPGSTVQQARAVFDLLMYQFDSLGEAGYTKLSDVLQRCLLQMFAYGNGILELGWQYREYQDILHYMEWQTPMHSTIDPTTGQPTQVPAGQPVCIPRKKQVQRVLNQPIINSIDIRDFYIDPNTPSANVQEARFAATRHLLTTDEIKTYAGMKGFKLPSDEALVKMTQNKTQTRGDQGKRMTESYRLGNWAPAQDYNIDPNKNRVEVIRYWDRQRTVWLLNRNWVMYNESNPYGFLPFLNASYIDVPGRFYSLALTDIVEGEQRLQQSVTNSRIDELALILHSPFIKKRGTALPTTSLRVGPGRVIEVEDPKNDLIKMEYPNVTQTAYIETNMSEARAEKYTGVTDIGVLGVASSGGNSANRTATGVSTQTSAAGKRIGFIIANFETDIIEPLCSMVHDMNKRFISPTQVLSVLGAESKDIQLNPLDILNANVHFEMRASDKLRSRAMVLQSMPLLLQTILNPAVLELLAQQQGLTADIKQVMLMVTDALNVAPMSLFRPMQPQEMQGMMQTNPKVMQIQAQQQMHQSKLQAQGVHQQDRGDTQILDTVLKQTLANQGLQKALTGFNPSEGDGAATK